MHSPYSALPPRNFWKSGVSQQNPFTINNLYKKKFNIGRKTRIATGGSCFAQHISRYLRNLDFHIIDAEPPPPGLETDLAKEFGYLLYSARYGNIYVVRHLLQLAKEAYGLFKPENWIWQKDGRFYDAIRPSVEPTGLEKAEDITRYREHHIGKVRTVFDNADLFIFTLGLTESWIDKSSGTAYPTAPGTIAGDFNGNAFEFKNFTFTEILNDFLEFRNLLRQHNPTVKFLLTVSPVPLTATATANHVLAATTYSKSVLRAVAGQLCDMFEDVDYFPSYEMVASPFSRGMFYEQNLRSVTDMGVQAVMRVFLEEHVGGQDSTTSIPAMVTSVQTAGSAQKSEDDIVCEDILLEAFAT
ncbi:MAG TPA: GSCFA domain-containing protein [Rhizomicrobium sp.]